MDRIEVKSKTRFGARNKAKNKLLWKRKAKRRRDIKIRDVRLIGMDRFGINTFSVTYDIVPSKDARK